MLRSIHIKNVALIERLDMEFSNGFNVLTGETGAGKSILIDAVNLVLGERASKELISHGADKAAVDAVFGLENAGDAVLRSLDELGVERSDELFLSRELSSSGKSVCRLNGIMVPLNVLKRVSDLLVDVHGQHEHQSLLNPASHIRFLDAFGAGELLSVKEKLFEAYQNYKALQKSMLSGFSSQDEREREMDILCYQIREIAAAKLKSGEEEKLNAERALLANAERIQTAFALSGEALSGDGGALALVSAARKEMQGVEALSSEYAALHKRLEEAYFNLEDIAYTLRGAGEGAEFDPKRLDAIETRLEHIKSLKRKYGASVASVLEFCVQAQAKLDALTEDTKMQSELSARLGAALSAYDIFAAELTKKRRSAADELMRAVLGELSELGLEKSRFEVRFSERAGMEPAANGRDDVEFLLSTNPGEPLKPLEKVASGGELSRIMLAFKAIFAQNDDIGTLIFDEVDTGVSGRTAAVVGEKMVRIADARQVICVTHLPQIAALADAHFLVEKHDDGKTTRTSVRLLPLEERRAQVALMMGGGGEGFAFGHAAELIEKGEVQKRERRVALRL
ncbi:MAG: DNA repair protein RecN [Eubacteriales bacterium]|nr:DNA repair protein RecN [Eubacteriales bacterium]